MNINFISKIILVIFLTLLFSIMASTISNPIMKVSFFLSVAVLATASVIIVSLQKVKQINQSIPTFLNFVNLTMSTGKSFANSFETAIMYQKKSIQPFYHRIHHLIFYLNEPNSSFFLNFKLIFTKKLFKSQLRTFNRERRFIN